MPASPWPFLDHPGPLPFAHQGGGGVHPENTMAAFEHAVAVGFRYLETDVHATADGRLVTFHDDSLDRMTDASGALAELSWATVRQARVGGVHPIPLLEEVIGTWPEVRVNIDPKADRAVGPLAELIRRTASHERVCVGAFSDRRLARVRRLVGPRLCTSLGPIGVARLKAAAAGFPVGRLPAACAQVPVSTRGITVVDAALVRAAHRRGVQVHVWTVDDVTEMERLLDLGVDGIMTDYPLRLRQVLEQRGAWA